MLVYNMSRMLARLKRFGPEFFQLAHFIAEHPLTRNHKTAAYARIVKWQIRSRIRGEVIVPWVDGVRLAVRRGMTGATANIYAGLHEFADMAFTLHFLRSGDLFADIGANVGSYTILASGVRGANTIAFEPDPQAAAFLRRNVDLNGLISLVQIEQVALGGEQDYAELTVGLDSLNRIARSHDGPLQRVRMRTLDGVVAGRPLAMIKIDVEGYEVEVFRRAGATLSAQSLKAIITEGRPPEVIAALRASGFLQYRYDPVQRKISRTQERSIPNALFLRDEAFVAARLAASPAFQVIGASV
jgi:FkbM family methyltransferase